ncbi:uncharacterized protein TRIADDRAFT_56139 [Trichoplax adhaerens]|uniref:Methyltransferase domain-containing protein n=1 Tax=Trichoplax adhaerens TaxID=10228 RepID=B3RXA4_TRIAD|nr:predicted protein [Trichoplax adhaerens]EDV24382.1 predicted protein [Trichoplax adhaerens]|eukprot:XP_002112272.1 predicted protein [Trichoplax adhaerens]
MSGNLNIKEFNYDQSYSAFERQSNDSQLTSHGLETFLKALRQRSIIFNGNQPVKVSEIACGPAVRTVNYFKNMDFSPGFDIRATDFNEKFTGKNGFDYDSSTCSEEKLAAVVDDSSNEEVGLIVKTFFDAIKNRVLPLKSFSVKRGNAFDDNLLELLAKNGLSIETERNTFSLVIASHCLYYVLNEKVPEVSFQKFFNSLTSDLLAKNGIAILCHSMLKPKSHIALETKYDFHKIKNVCPTPEEYQKYSIDAVIERHCQINDLPYYKMEVNTSVCYTDAFFNQQDIFKDIHRYNELDDDALDNLLRLLFIARRSAMDLYQDQSCFGLNSLVDEVVSIAKEDRCLRDYDRIYLVLSQHATQEFRDQIKSLVEDLNSTAP